MTLSRAVPAALSPRARSFSVAAIVLCAAAQQLVGQTESCEPRGDAGNLEGTVRERSSLLPLPGVRLVVTWSEGSRETVTDARGDYVMCALPPGTPMSAVARFQSFASSVAEFVIPDGARVRQDLLVDLQVGTSPEEGAGRIAGTLLDEGTGAPISGAVVVLIDHAAQALTDSSGAFRLDGVPAGEGRLEVRHIAYGRQEAAVDVPANAAVGVVLHLAMEPVDVEPLDIVVESIRDLGLETRGFYERQEMGEKLGLGHFFTADDIRRRQPRLITHMIADIPGAVLDCGGGPLSQRCEVRFGRNAPTVGCRRANVYIDGAKVIRSDWEPPGGTEGEPAHQIDQLIAVSSIAGMEIYPSTASTPAEFTGMTGQCGTIVIWSK
ncbi:MAG: carboxypeptidase regulatory-like domain-containing protein [Gemmatimonadota bacterium]|nr:carboxypeptidase regulatory-like domain-containing protein [Gemmatimonadota bacterium]